MSTRHAHVSLEMMEHLMLRSPELPIKSGWMEVTGEVDSDGNVYVDIKFLELHSGPGQVQQWRMDDVRSHMTLFRAKLARLAPHLTPEMANSSLATLCARVTRLWGSRLMDAEFLFARCDRSPAGRDEGRTWRRCLTLVTGCPMWTLFYEVAADVVTSFDMWLEDGELTELTRPHLSIERSDGIFTRTVPQRP